MVPQSRPCRDGHPDACCQSRPTDGGQQVFPRSGAQVTSLAMEPLRGWAPSVLHNSNRASARRSTRGATLVCTQELLQWPPRCEARPPVASRSQPKHHPHCCTIEVRGCGSVSKSVAEVPSVAAIAKLLWPPPKASSGKRSDALKAS